MNCQDAREGFSALLDGELGLTERAQIEAHLVQCTECGEALEQLHRLRPPDDAGRHRASVGSIGEPSYLTDVGVSPERRRLSQVLTVPIIGATAVILLTGLAIYAMHWKSGLDFAPRDRVPPAPHRSEASLAPSTSSPAPTISSPSPVETPSAARTDASPPVARSAPATIKPESQESTAAKSTAAKVEIPSPPARAEAASEPAAPAGRSSTDVVVQLSVQNRREAERDVTTLLMVLGGTRLGEDQSSTIMAVVPRSSYSDFTRGLAQLGSSQTETESASLPDPVHVAIRLAR
jgi:hypothetical protein